LQNPWSADRGIGRHVRELAVALGRWHPELDISFVTNPHLPVPAETIEALSPHGPVVHGGGLGFARDAIYHIPSPFEPSGLEELWPRTVRDKPLVVTLHDLIPAVFPAQQMPHPAVRRAYWARAELIRQADRVLSVSQATARDAARLLGLREQKLLVTGGGVSDDFRPPENRDEARAKLRSRRPRIDSEFVLYTGGMDYRKNVGGLLDAYAELSEQLQRRYKLVLVGRLGADDPRGPFAVQAESLAIADRVIFTGFVTDEELVLLYQAASLFVFPSLYEGFGLPVVEALACGAPALAGRNSSLVELVEQNEALFDAADPSSIREALARALDDEELLERLRRIDIRRRFTWRRIAELTAAAYAKDQSAPG
jgi:glycosyltransferase involved in cell wall biosynthesis